jgi:cytochrome c oxidase assembly protein subunit 15
LALLAGALGVLLGWPRRWSDALVAGLTGAALFGSSFAWPRCEPSPRWLRRLGLAALLAVVLQGVLGGLRVVLFRDQLGIFHATLAQLFFALVCALALFTSDWWQKGATEVRAGFEAGRIPLLVLATTVLILGQLILGAWMRHQHAGLAIPDFPLAYGKLWPRMDAASVALYNQRRLEIVSLNPITSFQIGLQMAHRLVAVLILAGVGACAWGTLRRLGAGSALGKLALAWLGLVLAQALLGALTIWSDKAADIATAHVLGGALCLALGTLQCLLWLHDFLPPRRRLARETSPAGTSEPGLGLRFGPAQP